MLKEYDNSKRLITLDILEIVFSLSAVFIVLILSSMNNENKEILFLTVGFASLWFLYHGITNLMHDIMFLPEEEILKLKSLLSKLTMSYNK